MATHSAQKNCALLLLLSILSVSLTTQDDLIVNTRNGKVKGKQLSVLGGHIRAFLGIPFAKPPIGKLRFRDPEPAERWLEVLDATNYAYSCYQIPDTSYPGMTHALHTDSNSFSLPIFRPVEKKNFFRKSLALSKHGRLQKNIWQESTWGVGGAGFASFATNVFFIFFFWFHVMLAFSQILFVDISKHRNSHLDASQTMTTSPTKTSEGKYKM